MVVVGKEKSLINIYPNSISPPPAVVIRILSLPASHRILKRSPSESSLSVTKSKSVEGALVKVVQNVKERGKLG